MASVGLMRYHSKMMVIVGSGGDTSWVCMHAYKTCSEYRIYKNTNVPVLRI